ncbi:uncharacterized protein VTP21DRAFT_9467 [Calcarisporiella thermophila]|uniref:uncharacterized protein n=1 Tax=Calcarisporiella thermophila TaxID=911321 RepID=UPI0037428931
MSVHSLTEAEAAAHAAPFSHNLDDSDARSTRTTSGRKLTLGIKRMFGPKSQVIESRLDVNTEEREKSGLRLWNKSRFTKNKSSILESSGEKIHYSEQPEIGDGDHVESHSLASENLTTDTASVPKFNLELLTLPSLEPLSLGIEEAEPKQRVRKTRPRSMRKPSSIISSSEDGSSVHSQEMLDIEEDEEREMRAVWSDITRRRRARERARAPPPPPPPPSGSTNSNGERRPAHLAYPDAAHLSTYPSANHRRREERRASHRLPHSDMSESNSQRDTDPRTYSNPWYPQKLHSRKSMAIPGDSNVFRGERASLHARSRIASVGRPMSMIGQAMPTMDPNQRAPPIMGPANMYGGSFEMNSFTEEENGEWMLERNRLITQQALLQEQIMMMQNSLLMQQQSMLAGAYSMQVGNGAAIWPPYGAAVNTYANSPLPPFPTPVAPLSMGKGAKKTLMDDEDEIPIGLIKLRQ